MAKRFAGIREGNGTKVKEDALAPAFVSRFRRAPAADGAGADSTRFRPLRQPAESAVETRPPEKKRARVPRRDILRDRVPPRTRTCPRCSREVSLRVSRCLSCGKSL